MGCSVSLPEVTATLSLPIPTMADTRIRGWFKKTILITTSLNAQLWLVVMPRGYYGALIFHDGPSAEDQVIAVAHHLNFRRTRFEITLPTRTELLNVDRGFFRSDVYWFETVVGLYDEIERFEWRRSNGKEVMCLAFATKGWKLVRVATVNNDIEKMTREERERGYASDGAQVVAVWTSKRIFSKKGHFRLLLAGEKLGPIFHMMALASALTLESNVIRREHNRQCGSGGGP